MKPEQKRKKIRNMSQKENIYESSERKKKKYET